MMDKQKSRERELPPPCLECRSLHKEYQTILCKARQLGYYKRELLKTLPIIGRIVSPWECGLCEEVET